MRGCSALPASSTRQSCSCAQAASECQLTSGKPDYDPTWMGDTMEKPIIAKGAGDPTAVTYTRNREGPYVGIDGKYHTSWRHGPRADPVKGFLFGLQGWNRVSYCATGAGTPVACSDPTASLITAAGEALDLWAASAGATVQRDQLEPPGDSEKPSAELVTLSAGASLSTGLGPFDTAGPVHGQLWIRTPAPSTMSRAASRPPGR